MDLDDWERDLIANCLRAHAASIEHYPYTSPSREERLARVRALIARVTDHEPARH